MKGAMNPERERDRIYQGRFEELKREVMIGIEASSPGEVVDGETAIQEIRSLARSSRETVMSNFYILTVPGRKCSGGSDRHVVI